VGFGFSDITLSDISFGNTNTSRSSALAPTLQVMAEYVRPLGGGLEMGVGYRFVRSSDKTFETNLGDLKYRAKHNELFARISWRFGSDSYSPPIAAPKAVARPIAPAAKPAPVDRIEPTRPAKPVIQAVEVEPAPLPKPFIVYFAFDKADISEKSLATIVEASEAFTQFMAVEIQAVGHTDTAGPEIYNEKLAQARVEAVQKVLVREGVPASKIRIAGEGENLLAVDTEDGVREGRNRRVEIKLVR